LFLGRGDKVRAVLVALGASASLLLGAGSASATTFTVTNGGNTGAGSLRQAISDAESNGNDPTVDVIDFAYTGNISLDSPQINISHPLTIDGLGPSSLNITRASTASMQFRFFGVFPDPGETITIRDLTMSGARAAGNVGGAVAMDGLGTLVLDSLVFDDNRSAQGGAVFYDRGFTSIRNSTLSNNQADFGGAILGSQFTPNVGNGDIVNSTIVGNQAADFGGGVYTNVSQIQILSSTIVGNLADSNGSSTLNGGGTYNGADAVTLSLANTIYAGNQSGGTAPAANQCGGDHTSFGYNLRETSDTDCGGFTATGDFVDSNAAMLGALGPNGGPTPTIALLAGNPAIDHGNDALPIGGSFPACPAADQRGLPRGGTNGRCDIGAFEVQVPTSGGGGGGTGDGGSAPSQRAAAIKKCKKKFRHNSRKRKKCIKKAKKRFPA
jgi:hypothetical protein